MARPVWRSHTRARARPLSLFFTHPSRTPAPHPLFLTLFQFERSVAPKSGSFYMRAVTSSVNFRTANGPGKKVHGNRADINDFFHGWCATR